MSLSYRLEKCVLSGGATIRGSQLQDKYFFSDGDNFCSQENNIKKNDGEKEAKCLLGSLTT